MTTRSFDHAGTCKASGKGWGCRHSSHETCAGRKLSLALFSSSPFGAFLEGDTKFKRSCHLKIGNPSILDPGSERNSPGAYLDGPKVEGRKLTQWADLSKVSKKDRGLVIKASGFHETAWGSRSVVIGNDVSGEGWSESISNALNDYPSPIYVIQEFMKPRSFKHPVFSHENGVANESGRVRLSPYFFTFDKKANWSVRLQRFPCRQKNHTRHERRMHDAV